MSPLLGVIVSWVGLVQVGPWVRVDSGGGCPRPWEEEGLMVRVRCVTLAPEDRWVPHVGGQIAQGGVGLGKLAHGLGLVLGMVAPGHGKSRG